MKISSGHRFSPALPPHRSAPFGLVCFVGAMGAMEYKGSWEGIKGKFSDVSDPLSLAHLWLLGLS